MLESNRGVPVAVIAIAAALLAGCAGAGNPAEKIHTVPPGDGRIVFAAPAFTGTAARRTRFADDWEVEEYALFRGGDARAEIIYATVLPGPNVALQYDYAIEDMLDTWKVNRNRVTALGAARRVDTRLGEFFYRPYTLEDGRRACFGFARDWDDPGDDPQHRPGKVFFGYYCAASGQRMSSAEMETLIRSFGVRDIGAPSGKGKTTRGTGAATQVAQGGVSPDDGGNIGFPFRFAVHYELRDND